MKVTIELDDGLVKNLIEYSEDRQASFQECVPDLLYEAIQGKTFVEMDLEGINTVVHEMMNHALYVERNEVLFKTNELYGRATGEKWVRLSPSTRKTLGKRFRSAVEEHAQQADEGDPIIEYADRNINNAALYRVIIKE